MAEISFVEVVETGPGWNKVLASDGNTYTLQGDYNWRSNNPGNIEYGPFARSMGAIGSGAVPPGRDRGFAIFPSYEDGVRAQYTLQFESPRYKDLPLKDAIAKYAPAFENNVDAYIRAVTGGTGITPDTKMSDLTAQQKAQFLAAQQQHEGYKPGTIKGEEGKPVPASVVRQFKGAKLPPMDIGLGTGQPNARDNIETQRVEQALMRNRVIPPIPAPRPEMVNGKVFKPLPAPAPLNKNNPLQKPVDLAAGANAVTSPRIGNFSTDVKYAPGAAKGATGAVTYAPPAPTSPTVPARRPDTAPAPKPQPKTQTATLPSGKSVEVGRIYTINGEDFIGGVNGGVGTLTKAPTSIIDEAKGNSVAGDAVRQAVRDETGKAIRGAVAAVPQVAEDAMAGISSLAGNVGEMFGNAFGGGGKPAERSPALASALARLGATVATKANIDLGQPRPKATGSASGTAGASGSASASFNLGKPGVVRTASAPEQQPIRPGVRPASVPSVENLIRLQIKQQPTARQNIQTGRQEQKSQPQYITKTRQVLVEDEPSPAALKASGKVGASLVPGIPTGVIGGGKAMLGAKGVASGALTYTAPVKKAPVYKTEEYQVRNPLYVAPKGPTAEEIAAWKRLQEERAAAAKAAAEAARLATLTPAGQAAQTPGIAHNYAPVAHAGERTDVMGNDMAFQPRSVQTSDRWNTGY